MCSELARVPASRDKFCRLTCQTSEAAAFYERITLGDLEAVAGRVRVKVSQRRAAVEEKYVRRLAHVNEAGGWR